MAEAIQDSSYSQEELLTSCSAPLSEMSSVISDTQGTTDEVVPHGYMAEASHTSSSDQEQFLPSHTGPFSEMPSFIYNTLGATDEDVTAASMLADHSFAESCCSSSTRVLNSTEVTPNVDCSPAASSQKLALLQARILQLEKENLELKDQLENTTSRLLSVDLIKQSKVEATYYTGLSSYSAFRALLLFLEPRARHMEYWSHDRRHHDDDSMKKFSLEDELFMVLVRLKTGMPGKEISRNFGISQGHFSKLFSTWINLLHVELKKLTPFPSVEEIAPHLPRAFCPYKNTRLVLDATEIRIQRPSSICAQRQTFSSYKSYNTYKAVLGCTPDGYVSFVSRLWGGTASDGHIVEQSGLLSTLVPGDALMVDKGFRFKRLPPGITLYMPPMRNPGEAQMSREDVAKTRSVASARVHVERVIRRVKEFHILDRPLPLNMVDVAEQLFHVCCFLSNWRNPPIKK